MDAAGTTFQRFLTLSPPIRINFDTLYMTRKKTASTAATPPLQRVALKDIDWLDHLPAMNALPLDMKRDGGFALHAVQVGEAPPNWSEMEIIGSGAKEIRLQDKDGWYRIFYVAKLSEAIFILGIVTKKTNKTSKGDIENAQQKYKDAIAKNAKLKTANKATPKANATKSKKVSK